jgi:hypothetical protein
VEGTLATLTGGSGIGLTITVDPLTEKIWTFGTDGDLTFPDSTIQTTAWTGTSTLVNGTSTVSLSSTGTLTVPSHIIPDADITYDLGSPTNRFRDLYLSGNTINLGDATISATGGAIELPVGTTTGGVNIGTIIILGSVADTTALTAISTATLTVGDSYVVASPAPAHLWTWNSTAFIDLGVFQGPQGELGYTGSRGYTGSQGNTGSQGDTGYVGSQGVVGYTGSTGIQGNVGYTGSQGIPGEYAALGYTGSAGLTGSFGFTGSTGPAGMGFTGSTGEPGATGFTGSTGPAGMGFTGSTGATGFTGSTGASASISWSISASGTSDYIFSGPGIVTGNTNDPVLYLYRGFTYTFVNTTGGSHPFAIRVSNGGADYTAGVSGSQSGTQTFTVPMNAPATLYYQCTIHSSMGNVINIV